MKTALPRAPDLPLAGIVPRRATTPRFEVAALSGGTTLLSSGFDLVGPGGGDYCAGGFDAATGGRVLLRTSASDAVTSVSYVRQAGRVTCHSRSYSRVWNPSTGETYVYIYRENTMGSGSGIVAAFGGDLAPRVRLIDGADVSTADPAFPLCADELTFGRPFLCSSAPTPIRTRGSPARSAPGRPFSPATSSAARRADRDVVTERQRGPRGRDPAGRARIPIFPAVPEPYRSTWTPFQNATWPVMFFAASMGAG